jgi:murein DD-endopeptidase MepM/ murein hydrolase activator NlpD
MLGQRFAYDLIRTDRRPGLNVHPGSPWRTNIIGGRTRECYAWNQPVHMPFDAEVVAALDGHPERDWILPIAEFGRAVKNGLTFRPGQSLLPLVGNHVIARSGDLFAVFAHLTTGSVAVEPGQRAPIGEVIGRVGHTGNSTSPHLHFQLMDGPDPLVAQGVPCAFRELEIERDGRWERVADHVPRRSERIRLRPADA